MRYAPNFLLSITVIAVSIFWWWGCAHHEPGRYQIDSLEIKGQRDLKERPALSCLISRERKRFHLTLGIGEPSCGEPPFDSQAPRINLWRWWWTDWPAFNLAVFEQDLERILRWYRARGYYDAQITETTFTPSEAADPRATPSCDLENDVCEVRIVVKIDEGLPTRVRHITWTGTDRLPGDMQRKLKRRGALKTGAPIDESDYDAAKQKMLDVLHDAGYAQARVTGRVDILTRLRQADVTFQIDHGPVYQFGKLKVEGHGTLPKKTIVAAASLPSGKVYRPATVREVQTEVYALGAFSSVEVHEEYNEDTRTVDIRVEVVPKAPNALRLGVGIQSGAEQRAATGELRTIPQWDIHLFGRYQRRHVFGTLGTLTVEERPRLIFSREFPVFTTPQFGNILTVRLKHPGLIEKRTALINEFAWDIGPDPFLGFTRSDIYGRTAVRRGFWSRKLTATVAVQQDVFIVNQKSDNQTSDGSELPSSYLFSFFEEDLRLDLRDSKSRPSLGVYVGINATQAPYWPGSNWMAFRLAPEVRTYVPLFFDIVWACRFAVAGLFIEKASGKLDTLSQRLGPSTYRLRGGGANSNRGFLPGGLGVGRQGGLRRWEASTELRVPLGNKFVVAGFLDAGDVNDQKSFRFSHLNTTAGWGVRFYTLVGVIRLDFGLRIPKLQRSNGTDGIESGASNLFGAPGAVHLTIGDAF